MQKMQECFEEALLHKGAWIGIAVQHENHAGPELILNPYENIKEKKEYYKGTYDLNLKHYFSSKISIVGWGYSIRKEELFNTLLP
jgi:hypothetical protein